MSRPVAIAGSTAGRARRKIHLSRLASACSLCSVAAICGSFRPRSSPEMSTVGMSCLSVQEFVSVLFGSSFVDFLADSRAAVHLYRHRVVRYDFARAHSSTRARQNLSLNFWRVIHQGAKPEAAHDGA